MTEHVETSELRITVEMGDDFQPSDRLTAALSELAATLADADDEVSGFGFEPIRSFTYTSLLGGSTSTGVNFPKVDNWIDKSSTNVFKF